ncbi:septum formation family protein [Protofrankia symbiont of Coriaria ruscifolia]|uniref:septum formation family protein n=1 Tax=Protofrankia symbiont of Coriaria ruscifolia TaxID=1306542 RepID=UPI001F5FA60A|nr:septum formation family protein [Protofrankia symbiont of Coriaria ruscifolia]
MPVVGCDQQHWGEVLGYVPLGAVPSPYPGDEQAEALTRFECGLLLAQQGLPVDQFTTSIFLAPRESWNEGGRRYENYGTCVVHRIDDQPLPRKQLTDPNRKPQDVSVQMDLYSSAISTNPPVGSCVATKQSVDTSIHAVPVVRCDRPHWAEVLGYPVLYEPDTPWPGDNVVYAAAEAACRKVAANRSLPANFRFNVNWPARDWWQDPKKRIYAVCLASRADGQQFTGGLT